MIFLIVLGGYERMEHGPPRCSVVVVAITKFQKDNTVQKLLTHPMIFVLSNWQIKKRKKKHPRHLPNATPNALDNCCHPV